MPEPQGQPPAGAALGVAAVARRLGVATATLRTWDRRYGLGPSDHVAGAPRRYTAADLARLDGMRRLLLDGVTPAEAARVVLEGSLDSDTAGPDTAGPGAADTRTSRPQRRHRPDRRSGGGRVVPLPDAPPAARGLARAAMTLDGDACTTLIASAVRRRGALGAWEDLLLPVLTGVGDRWRSTGEGVEVEHLLSESAETALRTALVPAGPADDRPSRPVLLAALEPEGHRLPLVALAAALAERGVPCRLLGPRLPVKALSDAVARTGPAAVFLWSSGAAGPVPVPDAGALPRVRPAATLVLGGPGYEADRWRIGLTWVADLTAAIDVLVAATGKDRPSAARPPR